jgi:hypothetical protein
MSQRISIERAFNIHPSLELRRREVRLRIRKLARRFGGELDMEGLLLSVGDDADTGTVRSQIEALLEDIAQRPYTAEEVRERLGITNQERLRWTKEGRLRRGGNEIIDRGQKIAVTTYEVASIDALALAPETIELWRLDDGTG